MNRINIIETDSTFNSSAVTSTDIAYVPGFAWTGEDGSVVLGAKAREPKLCSTIREFEYYFGTSPARFKSRQYYPVYSNSGSNGFSVLAVPDDYSADTEQSIWFRGEEQSIDASGNFVYTLGDADPAYIYARSLILNGIPVVYERLNQVADYQVKVHNYDESQSYVKNSIVIHNDAYYIATSASSNPAGTWSDAKWTKYKGYSVYDSSVEYIPNEIVYHPTTTSGISSIGYHKVSSKSITNSWENVTENTLPENTSSQPNWTSSGTYTLNSVVKYNGKNYLCITNSPSQTWTSSEWVIYRGYPVFQKGSSVYATDSIFYVLANGIETGTPSSAGYMKYTSTSSYQWTAVSESLLKDVATYDVSIDTFYNNVLIGNNLPVNTYPVFSANSSLLDKGEYSIKYLTTGGYPNFEYASTVGKLADKMAILASTRGDCIAFIDHTDKPERPLDPTNNQSVYYSVANTNGILSAYDTYATMITPWATYKLSNGSATEAYLLPASYGYLAALGNSKKTYATWLPISGTIRGVIPDLVSLHIDGNLTNSVADAYQIDPLATGTSVNPITYINPYGYCIWGNRTLLNLTTGNRKFATLFLNMRNLMSDIKKTAFSASQKYMFEQNTSLLWNKFHAHISSLLDEMKAGEGISAYKIIQNTPIDKSKLSATIKIWPIYAVESFDISITLTDDDVEVE